jgi:hypothetical protein
MSKNVLIFAATLLGIALYNTTASADGTLCKGEFEPRCPPHTYWINCDKDGQEHDAARMMCQSSGGVRALTGYSVTGGNKCGYATWQVLCNNSDAQNSGPQSSGRRKLSDSCIVLQQVQANLNPSTGFFTSRVKVTNNCGVCARFGVYMLKNGSRENAIESNTAQMNVIYNNTYSFYWPPATPLNFDVKPFNVYSSN